MGAGRAAPVYGEKRQGRFAVGRNPQGGFLEIQENRRPRKGVPLARPYGVRVGGWGTTGFIEGSPGWNPRIAVMIP